VPDDVLDIRYRLDVAAMSVLEVVTRAGGWLFDRVMAGWDVTVVHAQTSAAARFVQLVLTVDVPPQWVTQPGHLRFDGADATGRLEEQ
jgi:hypothetical protein